MRREDELKEGFADFEELPLLAFLTKLATSAKEGDGDYGVIFSLLTSRTTVLRG